MVLSPFSRWSAPLNMAIPPEFLVKSGTCMVILLGIVGPRDCPKSELLSLHLLNIGFSGISLNLGQIISHTLLGIIKNC
jgi:hypothetical protein